MTEMTISKYQDTQNEENERVPRKHLLHSLIHIKSSSNSLYNITLMENIEIVNCPVLRPTKQEFANFRLYVEQLDAKYKHEFGMVKVIPPKGWVSHQANYNKLLQNLVVNGPIEQNIFGKNGVYQCLHIPKKSMTLEQFQTKAEELDKITKNLSTDQIEKMFWKNVTFSAPLYGADLLNTLMDESSKAWNLNNLDSLLSDSIVGNKIRGINTPYCYVGSWKAFFCWHTEDLDLSGINFVHQGKSKFWYAINNMDKKIIHREVEILFPEHYSSCKQFLRHKTTLINPYYLKRKYPELRISKIEQKEGEFILVFGGSYHCGFNFGFNIAEAINYATLDWLRQMPESKHCTCLKSSVKASIYEIYKNLLTNESVNSTKPFLHFQQYIFKKIEEEESEEELEEAKKGVTLEFTKKIKKTKKTPKKITFNNEQYDIENWAQCDKCKIWRILKMPLQENQSFECKRIQKECHRRDKIDKKCFTIKVE